MCVDIRVNVYWVHLHLFVRWLDEGMTQGVCVWQYMFQAMAETIILPPIRSEGGTGSRSTLMSWGWRCPDPFSSMLDFLSMEASRWDSFLHCFDTVLSYTVDCLQVLETGGRPLVLTFFKWRQYDVEIARGR